MFSGLSFLGSRRAAPGGQVFHAQQPATGTAFEEPFHSASAEDVDTAAELAHGAFGPFSRLPGKIRAGFLTAIAEEIEALGQILITRASGETALPEARIKGETARTCGQLRLFAGMLTDGSWVDARIDHADPARQPLAKPDTRSMLRPIGPVVVFGASNFPMAYSTAGGDTASALAAGCPVIVKAHPAHPGTAEMVAGAVLAAAARTGMPDGVFSMLYDAGHEVGQALVIHPRVKAVGFTGSRSGGRALMDLAAARPEPIPVFAEMSSVNPVFLLPGALAERGEKIAAGLAASVTMGVGQFCTNPGLVIVDRASDTAAFREELTKFISAAAPGVMLTAGICRNYALGRGRLGALPGVTKLGAAPEAGGGNHGSPAVYAVDAARVLASDAYTEEIFGPSTLLITADGPAEMLALAESLEGQLTATVHGTAADLAGAAELLTMLEQRAGRLVCNGFPTGVEVNHSIVHGGPYPATSDGRSTSVGAGAILRFVRPVCWQDFPEEALPAELQEGNPLGIPRTVNGRRGGEGSAG